MTTFPLLYRSAYYHSAFKKLGNAFAYGVSALSWYGIYAYGFKPYIKEQEKEADLAATRMLCSIGQESIVQAYLNELRNELTLQTVADDWHYSAAEEYEYMTQCLTTYA